MKNLGFAAGFLALAFFLVAFTFGIKANFNVDKNASKISWKGEKVTGFHAGEIKVDNGTLIVDNGKLTGGSFTIDMNSITCTDLKPAEGGDKLIGHLKADDFFGTAKFPQAKFVITKATWQGGNNYKIVGNLTIKNITKELKFAATAAITDKEAKADAKIMIDRTDFDIKYGSGSFVDNLGDKTIYDNFELVIALVAKQ